MASKGEHNVPASPPSNRTARALSAVLRTVVETTGWERAFLVATTRGPCGLGSARVEASASSPPGRPRTPSRTVLRRALEESGRLACPDALGDPSFANRESVRALEIRSVASVPVPVAGRGAALVVDRRLGGEPAIHGARPLLEAYAVVLAALLGHDRPSPSPLPGSHVTALQGRSPAFIAAMRWARRLAKARLPVLVTGESGSGKEEFARVIHEDGPRAAGPFVAVNCAALPETLIESELFGATRGSYTGAERDRPGLFRLAHGGTLFLDEIGDMPSTMQAKLLRVLQDGRIRPVGGISETPVDVRIIAATHRDLSSLVTAGSFRQDLFWRLAMVEVRVPPLRERREDIPLIAEQVLARLREEVGTTPDVRLDRSAIAALEACSWPGNIRQLQAVLARAVLRTGSGVLSVSDLDLDLPNRPPEKDAEERVPLERRWIESALLDADGNLARAARLIGWSRQKLYRRMKVLRMSRGRSG